MGFKYYRKLIFDFIIVILFCSSCSLLDIDGNSSDMFNVNDYFESMAKDYQDKLDKASSSVASSVSDNIGNNTNNSADSVDISNLLLYFNENCDWTEDNLKYFKILDYNINLDQSLITYSYKCKLNGNLDEYISEIVKYDLLEKKEHIIYSSISMDLLYDSFFVSKNKSSLLNDSIVYNVFDDFNVLQFDIAGELVFSYNIREFFDNLYEKYKIDNSLNDDRVTIEISNANIDTYGNIDICIELGNDDTDINNEEVDDVIDIDASEDDSFVDSNDEGYNVENTKLLFSFKNVLKYQIDLKVDYEEDASYDDMFEEVNRNYSYTFNGVEHANLKNLLAPEPEKEGIETSESDEIETTKTDETSISESDEEETTSTDEVETSESDEDVSHTYDPYDIFSKFYPIRLEDSIDGVYSIFLSSKDVVNENKKVNFYNNCLFTLKEINFDILNSIYSRNEVFIDDDENLIKFKVRYLDKIGGENEVEEDEERYIYRDDSIGIADLEFSHNDLQNYSIDYLDDQTFSIKLLYNNNFKLIKYEGNKKIEEIYVEPYKFFVLNDYLNQFINDNGKDIYSDITLDGITRVDDSTLLITSSNLGSVLYSIDTNISYRLNNMPAIKVVDLGKDTYGFFGSNSKSNAIISNIYEAEYYTSNISKIKLLENTLIEFVKNNKDYIVEKVISGDKFDSLFDNINILKNNSNINSVDSIENLKNAFDNCNHDIDKLCLYINANFDQMDKSEFYNYIYEYAITTNSIEKSFIEYYKKYNPTVLSGLSTDELNNESEVKSLIRDDIINNYNIEIEAFDELLEKTADDFKSLRENLKLIE